MVVAEPTFTVGRGVFAHVTTLPTCLEPHEEGSR